MITIPLLFLLIAFTVSTFVTGVLQAIAYVVVTKAVWGWIGVMGCLVILPFCLMPGFLWWNSIVTIPRNHEQAATNTSRRGAVFGTVFTTALVLGFAMLMQWGHARVISWIADRDPDAAARAGVSGGRSPFWIRPADR